MHLTEPLPTKGKKLQLYDFSKEHKSVKNMA